MTQRYERNWDPRRSRSASDEARNSYYGLPVIHGPHWKWLIVWYFFLGGISSASYVIATIARLFGGRDVRSLARVGHYLSLATLIPSPILLILDLGRPERFLYMLRILKLRSPMSVGTWGLTVFGGFCGLTALIQAAEDGLLGRLGAANRLLLALPSRSIAIAGSAFAFFVGGYTGVLLGITAVPLWAKNRLLLGPLFLASAMSSAAAALALALSLGRNVSHPTLRRLERFDTLVLLVELGLALSTRRHSGRVIGRPLREGHLGRLFNWGVLGAGIGVPIVLQSPAAWGRGHVSRAATIAASLFVLAGGLTLRYVMVMAGHISGDDPAATFEYTRGDEPATTYTGTPETMASLALNDASAEGEATNTREGQQ